MSGTSFCPECSAPTTPLTEICIKCGARVAKASGDRTSKAVTAGILAIIAGVVTVTIDLMVLVSAGVVACPFRLQESLGNDALR